MFQNGGSPNRALKVSLWFQQSMEVSTVLKPQQSTAELKRKIIDDEEDAEKPGPSKKKNKHGRGKKKTKQMLLHHQP